MARQPASSVSRQQLLHVQEVSYNLRPVVQPVTLETKSISMLTPSTTDSHISQPTVTSTTTTTSLPSSQTTTTTSSASSPLTSTTTTTTAAAAPSHVPASTSPSSPEVTATTRPVSTSATAAASTVTAAATATSVSVGGKGSLGEEGPIIILTHPPDNDQQQQQVISSDVPGSDTQRQQQQQFHFPKQKPEEATSQLSPREHPVSDRGREPERKGSKHGVQFSDTSPKRDVSDVMQFFQEQEESLQQSFLSLPKSSHHKKQRSPSPKFHQAAGLEHLDNLIRLMEQLTSLKDENSRLRKRCDYLESTKILLQAKRELSIETSSESSGFMTLPAKHHHHHHHHRHHHHNGKDSSSNRDEAALRPGDGGGRLTRPRISSADELEYLEIVDSSSDQRPKRAKSALHKRSFSTGSLEVPSEMIQVERGDNRKRIKGKTGRSIFSKSSSSKQKSKSSKWARVKKVLTGQKLYEDLGTTIRTLRDLGRSSHIRYSSSGGHPSGHEFSSTSSRLSAGETGGPDMAHDTHVVRPSLSVAPALVTDSALHGDQESDDTDLTTEIWMGPPDWWEEYEAKKESGGTSTNSEVSSVIEVTTMYLGSKKDATTSTISPTATTTSTTLTAPATTQEKYLSVEMSLPRRQSSPSLSTKEAAEEEEDDILDELTSCTEPTRILHKSSSCKSADLDLPKSTEFSPSVSEGRSSKKSHRSAWGRVKDIIHTRKDSIKKKPKREKTGIESEETSEIDMEALLEEQWRSDVFAEGLLSRSTPKTSPMIIRQHTCKGTSGESPPGASGMAKTSPSRQSSYHPGSSPGNVDMAALLASSMSDDFSKKMQQWEQMRSKKSPSFRASIDESDLGSLDVSSVSQEFPVRTVDLRDLRGKVPDSASEGFTPEESNTSMEVLGAPSINVEEMQRRMTDSFSRKMQEWERLKYKGSVSLGRESVREASPDMERKGSKGRKEERHKSKRSREEKEKEKWERQREREMQKVEREQVKLEKEKLRIEKERLRALEREAKLEKLKGRLSQAESEPSFRNPVLSPLAEYKVTADFARKLHEWELKKGLSHDVSNSIYLEAQTMRQKGRLDSLSKPEPVRFSLDGERAEGAEKASPPPPLTLQPYWDSPEERSPVEKYSDISLADGDDETCTSVTEECLTKSNIVTLERANTQLLETLHQKEMEYEAVQEEVHKVNEKLAKVREEHASEMARFHRELAQGQVAEPVRLEVGELETTMGELEEKIQLMQNFGERLASSMESAAVGKWQSIEGEETVHTQLVELVDQMRGMLVQATQSEEQSQKTMALSNFETLYSQAMKLQVQMNNLRLSHLERNREIMVIKRQLLLQEVNNLLLQADITRRETELYQFHEAKRFASLRRWNTFSGAERQRPQAQMELPASGAVRAATTHKDSKSGSAETPRINIPYIAEEATSACAASSSLSAPASPSAIAAAGGAPVSPPMIAAGQSHSSPGAARQPSADPIETHLLTPSLARRERPLSPRTRRSFPLEQVEERRQQVTKDSLSTLKLPAPSGDPTSRRSSSEYPSSSPATTPTSTSSTTPTSPTTPPMPATPPTPPTPATVIEKDVKEETKLPQPPPPSVAGAATSPSSPPGAGVRSARPPVKPELTTLCDSAPLYKEIEELRRAKRKVEKGSSTLKKSESEGPSPVPSPGLDLRLSLSTETPDQSIPKQRSQEKPRLVKAAPIIDDDYSPATSVMECTETPARVEQTRLTTDSELGAVGGASPPTPPADTSRRDLPPSSDPSKAGSRSPRSPGSKHKLLRRQKEERDTKLKDYRAISPKGSPIATRGKPPLPRQTTPVRQSPSASPAAEKGARSKSVGDMERGISDSPTTKPLQEAINRFEKRATVCETEDRPIELRKTPSPTLHLPRVGLVQRVRRLKPAAELLEESQRYRSGHSIYATRIMQKYLQKDEHKPGTPHAAHNKENTYVHSIVQRLSRETTPVRSAGSSRTNSDLSLKRTDSPRTHSEFVSHIVRKLSSSSGPEPHKTAAPFKDLTNEGQVKKLAKAFNGHAPSGSPERTLSDTDIDRPSDQPTTSATKAQHRKSCEVAMVLSSSASPTSEASYQMVSSMSSDGDSSHKPDSTTGPTNHQSLPALATPSTSGAATAEELARGRAATYCTSETEKRKGPGQEESVRSLPPSASSSPGPQQHEDSGKKSSKAKGKSGKPWREKKGDAGRFSSSLSPDRKGAGRGKMGTVGVLCKQSISFDLGVSLYTQSQQGETTSKSRQARSWDPSESVKAEAAAAAAAASEAETPSTSQARASSPISGATAIGEARPLSSSSEGEVVPGSPTADEKKKSRKFLDSSWLQKSKKFFKVSK